MKVGYQHIMHEVSLYQKNIIAHCGNNQKNNQMIMTAVLHDVWSHGRPLNYYYYISVGGLGTAMEWLNDLKYLLFIS